jgi:murein L,D-transpeptidase YafK
MRVLLLTTILLTLLQAQAGEPSFRDQQLTYPRVQAAYAATWSQVQRLLQSHTIDPSRLELFFRAFKIGRRLEVWGRNQGAGPFQLLRTYPIAGTSGSLGPKRAQGDGQVPEGFYEVDRFNPCSLYYLSLGLNYPNAADRLLGSAQPGQDIFIHGSDVTIGCLPITDALIQEAYVLAVEAHNAGQQTMPVHIFPFALSEANLLARQQSRHYAFWQSLRPGYEYFEQHHTLPEVTVDLGGSYVIR